jgi:hypothetical protein
MNYNLFVTIYNDFKVFKKLLIQNIKNQDLTPLLSEH